MRKALVPHARMRRGSVPSSLRRRPSHGLRSWYRFSLWLLALVLAVPSGSASMERFRGEQVDQRPWKLLPPEQVRRTDAVSLAIVLDQSSSMIGNDPHNARVAQVEEMLTWLSFWGRPDDEVSVIQFAGDAAGVGPAAVIDGPPTIRSSFPLVDGTEFAPAFVDAARRLNPEKRTYVLLLSDGEGDDQDAALRSLPEATETFVIGLDEAGGWSNSRRRWERFISGSWRARHLVEGELARPIAAFLTRILGQEVTAEPIKSDSDTDQKGTS